MDAAVMRLMAIKIAIKNNPGRTAAEIISDAKEFCRFLEPNEAQIDANEHVVPGITQYRDENGYWRWKEA